MALSLFGGRKPDHPLADDKSAKEALAALPRNEPEKALEEIRDWVVSVAAVEEFKPERRAEIYLLLDETALPFHRKLTRDYVSTPGLTKTHEARLWKAVSGYWGDLSSAYGAILAQCIADSAMAGKLKAQLALLCLRAMRAYAGHLKWQYFHYETDAGQSWKSLGDIYRFAAQKKLNAEPVRIYSATPQTATIDAEFVKLLMLNSVSPNCMPTVDIELAEWIIAHLSASFLLSETHQPQVSYNYVDLAAGEPPKRLVQVPAGSPNLRFFAAGQAAAKLDALIKIADGGALPSDLQLGGAHDPNRVRAAMGHLQYAWSSPPPVRKSDRYEVKHRLNIAKGRTGITARLQGDAPGAEVWTMENISSGGLAAVADNTQSSWLSVGALVGMSVEGGSGAYSVGVVRRLSRRPKLQSSVGVRTLAKLAIPITFGGVAPQEALLLTDERKLGDEIVVCLNPGGFDKRIGPLLEFEGEKYLLRPLDLVSSGEDYDLARYKVMRST